MDRNELTTFQRKTLTAIHEAGHAVVAYMFMRSPSLATIKPSMIDGKNTRGHVNINMHRSAHRLHVALVKTSKGRVIRDLVTDPKPKSKSRQLAEIRREIAIYMAGGASQRELAKEFGLGEMVTNDLILGGMSKDIDNSLELAKPVTDNEEEASKLLDTMFAVDAYLLRLLPYRNAVKSLATALLERETIRFRAVREIITSALEETLRAASAQECDGFLTEQYRVLNSEISSRAVWKPLYEYIDQDDSRPIWIKTKYLGYGASITTHTKL